MEKKKLIIICVAILLGAAVLFFMLASSKKAVNKTSTNIPLVTPSENFVSLAKKYDSQTFSFSYPQNSSLTTGTSEDGTSTAILEPNSYKNIFAKIVIQKYSAGKTSLEDLTGLFKSYGYSESNITVGKEKIPAVLYSGKQTYPSGTTQERAAIFQQNGYLYKIQLTHDAVNTIPELEQAFANVLSTFEPR